MNRLRLTLLLVVLLALTLGAVFWLDSQEKPVVATRDAVPFEAMTLSEVQEVHFERAGEDGRPQRLLVQRDGAAWKLFRGGKASAESSRARPMVMQQWMEAFASTRPLRARVEKPDLTALS